MNRRTFLTSLVAQGGLAWLAARGAQAQGPSGGFLPLVVGGAIGPGATAWVRVAVADVRVAPSTGAALDTQILLGERVRARELSGAWARIVALDQPSGKDPEGYPGWTPLDALTAQAPDANERAVVMVPRAALRTAPDPSSPLALVAPLDSRLGWRELAGDWVRLALPGGGTTWTEASAVRRLPYGSEQPTAEAVLATARRLLGTPYLWGGMSALRGVDCSGFTYRVFHAHGLTLPRDTGDIIQHGTPVARDALQPGDLVLSSRSDSPTSADHVSLVVDSDGGLLETRPGGGPVAETSLATPYHRDYFLAGRRYL